MKKAETDLVGGITISHNSISTDDNAVDLVLLEERADHGIAEEQKIREIYR